MLVVDARGLLLVVVVAQVLLLAIGLDRGHSLLYRIVPVYSDALEGSVRWPIVLLLFLGLGLGDDFFLVNLLASSLLAVIPLSSRHLLEDISGTSHMPKNSEEQQRLLAL